MSGQRRAGFAQTSVHSPDPALRGRTCAIPFEGVWQSALRLAGGGIRGWTVVSADDESGEILAMAHGIFGAVHDIAINVVLDADAQTRVDARAAARRAPDLGRSRRRLLRFFRALDHALAGLPPGVPPPVPRPTRTPAQRG
jgi:hypothetical protein